jgi:hypothetical protein
MITGICSLNMGKINVLYCIVLCMNVESTIPRGRQRNRWQDEVTKDGRIVGGEEWQEKVYNRGMEEAPENGKELSHSANANGIMNE